jgi:O-antigen/teichoic acid export membrane protein
MRRGAHPSSPADVPALVAETPESAPELQAAAGSSGQSDIVSRALRGSLVGLLGVGIGMATTIAMVPLVLRTWSDATYAVWLAVFSVYSLLQTIDIGHTAYLSNEFMRRAHDDPEGYRRAFASGLRLSVLLGAAQVGVAVAILALGLVPRTLGLPLGGREGWEAGLALVVMSLGWWASGSFGGVIAGLYFPHGHFVRAQWWAIANKLLLLGCVAIPVLFGGGVLAAAVATALGNVLFGIALWIDAYRHIPMAREWRGPASWSEALTNARHSLAVTVNNASQQLGTSGLALAVAALLGATVLPIFVTLRTLANAAAAVTMVGVSPIVPDMVRYGVRREWQKLRVSFEGCWFGVGLAVHVGALASFPLVGPFYAAWTHRRIRFDATLYVLLVCSIGVAAIGAPALRYLQAMNRLRAQTVCNVAYLGVLVALIPLLKVVPALELIGAALVVAELTRSVLAMRYVTAEAAGEEAERIARAGRAAAVPLAIVGAALTVGALWPAHRLVGAAVGLLALAPVYLARWRALDLELRLRLRQAILGRTSPEPAF